MNGIGKEYAETNGKIAALKAKIGAMTDKTKIGQARDEMEGLLADQEVLRDRQTELKEAVTTRVEEKQARDEEAAFNKLIEARYRALEPLQEALVNLEMKETAMWDNLHEAGHEEGSDKWKAGEAAITKYVEGTVGPARAKVEAENKAVAELVKKRQGKQDAVAAKKAKAASASKYKEATER